MDLSLVGSIPTPIGVERGDGYIKALKGAKLTLRHRTATLSPRARALLAECCESEGLPCAVPPFLAIHETTDPAAFLLLRPVLTASETTLRVTLARDQVRIHPARLRAAGAPGGAILSIRVSSVSIQGWGSALVLHMGLPIKRRGDHQDDLEEKNT